MQAFRHVHRNCDVLLGGNAAIVCHAHISGSAAAAKPLMICLHIYDNAVIVLTVLMLFVVARVMMLMTMAMELTMFMMLAF